LVLVPLLLLATPQRATLHGLGHHAGARHSRADGVLTHLSTSWTTPAGFTRIVDASPRSTASNTEATHRSAVIGPVTHVMNVSFRQVLPPTTTTTTPPPPVVAPRPPAAVAVAVVAAPKPPAPVPAPAPKPVAAPVATAPAHQSTGGASWYSSPAGTCASPTLAFGTVVTVTDLATGVSVHCTVDDREAHNPGRVIDLSPTTFSQLARLAVGVIEVRLTW
jgi:rare lipoprotein A (peptidoglycan hydrolase)